MLTAEGQDYPMQQPEPRHIEGNPALPDGLYDSVILDISLQRSSRDTQIFVFFCMPDQKMHLVTDIREVAQDGVSSALTTSVARPRMG